jgi:hypothetical protein
MLDLHPPHHAANAAHRRTAGRLKAANSGSNRNTIDSRP